MDNGLKNFKLHMYFYFSDQVFLKTGHVHAVHLVKSDHIELPRVISLIR